VVRVASLIDFADITLDGQQNVNPSLQQVPPPFILPDTPQEQPSAPVVLNNALPVIVSSSAESTDSPQIVNVPEFETGETQTSEQSSSNDSKPTSSLSTGSDHSGDKTLATDGSSGSGGKSRGILSNWAPAAAALKGPLAMQRSLSEFFGRRTQGPAEDDRTSFAQTERRVSHSSTNSDASSLGEGKSGILYYRANAKDKRGSVDTNGSGWSGGERRNRLPEGASGVAVHKDLWKVCCFLFSSSRLLTSQSLMKCPRRATLPNVPSSSALRNDAIIVVHADRSSAHLTRVSRLISGIHQLPTARNREVVRQVDVRATKRQTTRRSCHLNPESTRLPMRYFVRCRQARSLLERVLSSLREFVRIVMTRFGTRIDTSRENVHDARSLEVATSKSISIAIVKLQTLVFPSPIRNPLRLSTT
jgi:hypothetical protein